MYLQKREITKMAINKTAKKPLYCSPRKLPTIKTTVQAKIIPNSKFILSLKEKKSLLLY